MMGITYDEALPRFAAIVKDELGDDAPLDNYFLRDASGKLTIVLTSEVSIESRKRIEKKAERIVPYIEAGSATSYPHELLDPVFEDPDLGAFERIDHPSFRGFVRVFERRIVGQDWLVEPQKPIVGAPPVIVFASHKGGVGRSTALGVAAASLADRGMNILVVDLDLEAPGLAEIFLDSERVPLFGTLDFLVETTLQKLDENFLENMTGVSGLTHGRGLVHVCPALGTLGFNNPQNVLGKIARAYLEAPDTSNEQPTFMVRVRSLIDHLAKRNRYDVIFVDSRAGLNESTAASVLGLGADVLLFGVDSPQTFRGYRYFLSYLQRFRPSESDSHDWRARIRMVHAKASPDPKKQAGFRTQAFDLFADTIYDLEEEIEPESFNFDYDDEAAPHFAWPILYDSNFDNYNPLESDDQLKTEFYMRTFGEFIEHLIERIEGKGL